ncbi:MAG: hypothetical protein OXH28_05755 [bacterium]|nr:hypothetical protein [bacterium]MXV89168.1 hypothetical protein [Acidimicrobiia bacterium]MYC44536.1 hypothetical protein [Acidimicrobiia bacterium]MYI19865.1 hypothetical protein [Acidimicrobiia bacterium]
MDYSAVLAQAPHAPTAVKPDRVGLGTRRPGRVYLWRRAIVAAALVCLLWGALWGVFQLGGLVGARLVAPALGTAPVPVVDGAQADS